MKTTKKFGKKSNANMVECLHGLLNMLKVTLNKKNKAMMAWEEKVVAMVVAMSLFWI
jgi:hypothetical protein